MKIRREKSFLKAYTRLKKKKKRKSLALYSLKLLFTKKTTMHQAWLRPSYLYKKRNPNLPRGKCYCLLLKNPTIFDAKIVVWMQMPYTHFIHESYCHFLYLWKVSGCSVYDVTAYCFLRSCLLTSIYICNMSSVSHLAMRCECSLCSDSIINTQVYRVPGITENQWFYLGFCQKHFYHRKVQAPRP